MPLPPAAAAVTAVTGGQQFSLGSTEDEVRRIMGTPMSIIGGGWSYGYSSVSFRDGRVVGYSNITGLLKVVLKPSDPLVKDSTFTMGSSKDQVLRRAAVRLSLGDRQGSHLRPLSLRQRGLQSVRDSVPRCDTSIVSSTMARPTTDRAPIDVVRAFFSKFLGS